MVKAKGSWVTLGTSAQKTRVLPTLLFTTTQKFLLVCLVGKFACIKEYISFCANRPFFLHVTQGCSPGILSSKFGQPVTNCKRMFFNGFWPRNMSSITYQKSPKIRAGDVDEKQVFLEPYSAQHGNEVGRTACCVARV